MNPPGDADLRIRTRQALLLALEALSDQLDAVVVVGAQAIYLRTGKIDVALPEETQDADIGIDANALKDDPRLEEALGAARFHQDVEDPQPGRWISPDGIPVDLMIPEAMAGPRSKRGARVPPHDKGAMRRTDGLEAIVVDYDEISIGPLDRGGADGRRYQVRVAGPGALLVAKLHKLGERDAAGGERLRNKDAHDLYRLLVAVETAELAAIVTRLLNEKISAQPTERALGYLADLFADGPDAVGSAMAGAAEEFVGDPPVVSASVAVLAADLLVAVERMR